MTTPTTVNVRLQLRADTAANWTAANPILLANEVGLETDTKKLKVGNGSSAWNSLAYFPSIVSGGTVLGNLEIGSTGTLTFEGSTADGFETTLAVTNPTADRTITLPNQSGTVVVSGNASIVDADIAANAEIAVSKLADGSARQLLQTDAAGTGVEWTSNVDIPGTLDVTGAATFDSAVTIAGDLTVNGTTTNINTQNLVVEDKNIILADVTTPSDSTADGGGITLKGATDKTITWSDTTDAWTSNQVVDVPAGSAATPSLIFGADVNSGIYSPGADQVAISTNGVQRLLVLDNNEVSVGAADANATGINIGSGATGDRAAYLDLVGDTTYTDFGLRIIRLGGANSDSSIRHNGTGALNLRTQGSAPITLSTFSAERLRITSDGKLGVGTSSPSGLIHLQGASIAETWYTATNTGGATWRVGTADTSSGLSGAYRIYDSTNSAARLLIDNTGNVGIGTTAPGYKLHVTKSSDVDIVAESTSTGAALMRMAASTQALAAFNSVQSLYGSTESWAIGGNGSQNTIAFRIAGSEKARIDSSGRLLVGTSSARANFFNSTLSALLQVEGADHNTSSVSLIRNTVFGGVQYGPNLVLASTGGNTIGSNTVSLNGGYLGTISFQGTDGTKFVQAAEIRGEVDGTPGANDMPGRLVFSTTLDGTSSTTEALRITNDRVVAYNQPDVTSKSAAATLTIAELKTGIIQYTGAAATLTLPTGTLSEGGFSGIYTNMTFEWSVINTGSGTCTIGAGTAHTIVGGATVAAGASGRFASRRTAANTFVTYRLS